MFVLLSSRCYFSHEHNKYSINDTFCNVTFLYFKAFNVISVLDVISALKLIIVFKLQNKFLILQRSRCNFSDFLSNQPLLK